MVQNSLQGRLPGQDPVSSSEHINSSSLMQSRNQLPLNTLISSPPLLSRGDAQASGLDYP